MSGVTHPDDLAYARALAAGNTSAVLGFEPRYRPLIDHAVVRALGKWNPEAPLEPEDLVQDFIGFLFVDGGRRLTTFKGQSRFSSWLYTVALRYFQRQLARRSRDRRGSEAVLTQLPARADQAPDRVVIRGQEAAQVRAAVHTLPEMDRLYVRLFFVEGLNASEVAQTLGKKPSAVRMRKMRILERLRAVLEAEGERAG